MNAVMPIKLAQIQARKDLGIHTVAKQSLSLTPCVNNLAGEYPCDNIDLQSFVSLNELGSQEAGLCDIFAYMIGKFTY